MSSSDFNKIDLLFDGMGIKIYLTDYKNRLTIECAALEKLNDWGRLRGISGTKDYCWSLGELKKLFNYLDERKLYSRSLDLDMWLTKMNEGE